jgi:hypothetical protein
MKAEALAFSKRHTEIIAFLALYTVLFAVWSLTGGSFRVWPDLWQLLPWPPLLRDLGTSLVNLHSQPPILNLLFGLALKASAWTGITVEVLLQPLYFAVGAFTVISITAVAMRIIYKPVIRRIVILLVVLNPYFYAVHHYLFYTAWELLFLCMIAFLSLRYFEHPSAMRLLAALAPAILLVYTRSLFHPLWFAFLLAMLLALGRPMLSTGWRAFVVVSAVSLVLVAAWPLKNLIRFGFFGYSSWSGMSIARGLPTGEPLLPSGYPSRLAPFARSSSEPLDPQAAARAQRLVPPEFSGNPTLSELTKPDGSPNWNHYALIPLSHELGIAAFKELRQRPSLLFMKALDFYLNGYAIYEARWPYQRGLSPEMTTGKAWSSAYEAIVFQTLRPYDPNKTTVTTGFAILFPIILIMTGIILWRRPWGTAERTVIIMLSSVLWVLALVLFVDGPEGNRVRFSTEPYLFLLAGWLVEKISAGRSGTGDISSGVSSENDTNDTQ